MKRDYCISDLSGFKELCKTELIRVGVKGGCKDSYNHTVDHSGHLTGKGNNKDNSGGSLIVIDEFGIVAPERTEEQKRDGPILSPSACSESSGSSPCGGK